MGTVQGRYTSKNYGIGGFVGSRIWQWLNERWPFSPLINLTLDEEIPGGSSFAYTEGSAVLIIFILQAVTGVMQLFFYVPTIDHAYDSLSYLRTEAPFGWLMHGLHYWGANLMIVAVVVHMIRVFIWGAYKKPRELTWLAGVLLVLTTMALSFTGTPLPWNQKGYWAGEVGTSIAGTTPFIGDLVKRLLRGGEQMGQLALSRFFVMHTSVFPLLLVALFGFHIIAFRKFGSVGPWNALKRRYSGPFWPDQAYKDALVSTGVFFILIALSVYVPPGFAGPADILDTSYVPKPEWNFLFLYEALKYFQGPLEPVGTIGVPTVIVLLLVLLPFIDRNPETNPLRRPFAMLCGLLFTGVLAALTISGYYSPGFARAPVSAGSTAPPQAASQPAASQPAQTEAASTGKPAPRIFQTAGCTGCHRVGGTGGTTGPELSGETLKGKSREWIVEQIRNPKAHNPGSIMPAFASLPDQQMNEIVSYLTGGSAGAAPSQANPRTSQSGGTGSQEQAPVLAQAKSRKQSPAQAGPASSQDTGQAAGIIGSADRGAALFALYCTSCHGQKGTGNIPNPGSTGGTVPQLNPIDRRLYNKDPRAFAGNIGRFIQHGSAPAGSKPSLSMPAFGDGQTLTQQEIANIEAYILSINGVDRAQLINPGMRPRNFFILITAVYVLIILLQGGIRIRRNIS